MVEGRGWACWENWEGWDEGEGQAGHKDGLRDGGGVCDGRRSGSQL